MAVLSYFDCNAMLGRYFNPAFGEYLTADRLEQRYERYRIGAGVVYHASARDYSPASGNQTLINEIRGRQRLHPCWVIVPHHTGEMPHPEELAPTLLGSGARMVRIFCGERYYSERLDPFLYGAVLEMLEHHRIPLMVEFEVKDNGGGALDASNGKDLRSVLDSFPQLRLILACPKSTGMNRILFPLMEKHEHFALETSGYQLFGGLEAVARRFGARRLLYGSRAPYFDPAPGMIALQYSELEETEKQLIAGKNLRKLFSEVLV